MLILSHIILFICYAGMGMIFDIDGESAEKTIPSNFPVCGDFILD